MNNIQAMTNNDFEGRFFDLLKESIGDFKREVRKDLKGLNGKIDKNTQLTESVKEETHKTNTRVKKLEDVVYKKKANPLTFLQDRQLVYVFLTALTVFLLILANILGVKIPSW